MRRTLTIILGVFGMLLLPLASHAQTIVGSAHDFSSEGWAGGEICKPCHTPHNADTSVTGAPLWNHTVTTATFTTYSSPTLNATPGAPAGSSRLCLSCHDGTVALDSMINGGSATPTVFISGTADVGTDLSNDHPISFTYDTSLATNDGELYDPATTPAVAALLFAGQLECASCHDPHNTTGFASLLRVNNAASGLCLTCHNK